VNRLVSTLLSVGLTVTLSMSEVPSQAPANGNAWPEPAVTPLDLHPVEMPNQTGLTPMTRGTPMIVRPGVALVPDQRQIAMPAVVTPTLPWRKSETGAVIGKAGTGFFVAENGTLLTAAHVVKDCSRAQVVSKYVERTWVTIVAADQVHDIALLRAAGMRPPAIARIATAAPVATKLFILGYPAAAGLTVPAETWAVLENEKFPSGIGSLVNPREVLWLSAPGVEHGYSGGPIFDPKQGAVVGLVKGEVEGGYLRLVHDMPTTGIAIGPGIAHIGELLHSEVPYSAISLVSSPGEAGEDTLRRATVHVLCWN
jgi:S1-C subfamily serine protease